MIHYKTPEEITTMKVGGKILAEVLFTVLKHAQPGVSESELDSLAEKLIRDAGAEPGFQRVPGYKHATCMSTNSVVVHGIPTQYKLQKGDVLGIDCGVYLDGFHTDMSESIIVGGGANDHEKQRFLAIGKKALTESISLIKPGNRVGHISKTIQTIVEGNGFSIVRNLVGHGVGHELHEEPEIPGYLSTSIEKTPLLREGMVIAVEIIYNMGKKEVIYADDGWTIKTKDNSISGLFERTIAITKDGHTVLTE